MVNRQLRQLVMRALGVAALLVMQYAAPHRCAADDSATNSDHTDREQAKFIIEGVLNRIQSIRSGDVRVSSDGVGPDGTLTIHGSDFRQAFDYAAGLLHFDHIHKAGGGRRNVMLVRSDQRCFQHVESNGPRPMIQVYPADFTPTIPEVEPPDWRLVGLVGDGEMSVGWKLEDVQTRYWMNLDRYYRCTVRRLENGIVELQLDFRDEKRSEARVVVKIDESKDYVPIEHACYYRSAKESGTLRLIQTNTATWQKVSGIWVPMTWTLDRSVQAPLSYTFTWLSVNAPLDPKLFTIHGMGLPADTEIVNMLLGQGVIEGRLGEEYPDVSMPPANRSVLVWINVGLLVACGALFVYRRIRRTAATRKA